jgi:hypothetical protein
VGADVVGPHLRLCAGRSTLGVMDGDRAVAILKTDDMAETIRWYLAAGFELRDQFPGGDPTWCELARDGLVLQFLAGETPWPGTPTMTGCLYLYPTSVVAVHEELRDIIDLEWGIEDRDWGRRELVVRDPSGYFLTFAGTPATSRRRGERTPPCSHPPETSEHVPPVGIVEMF